MSFLWVNWYLEYKPRLCPRVDGTWAGPIPSTSSAPPLLKRAKKINRSSVPILHGGNAVRSPQEDQIYHLTKFPKVRSPSRSQQFLAETHGVKNSKARQPEVFQWYLATGPRGPQAKPGTQIPELSGEFPRTWTSGCRK
jgi:hypothetical protein